MVGLFCMSGCGSSFLIYSLYIIMFSILFSEMLCSDSLLFSVIACVILHCAFKY